MGRIFRHFTDKKVLIPHCKDTLLQIKFLYLDVVILLAENGRLELM